MSSVFPEAFPRFCPLTPSNGGSSPPLPGAGGLSGRGRKTGFTLVELLVAILLVGVCIAGAFGGLAALGKTDARAHDAALLQRLAAQKLAEIPLTGDPTAQGDKGDFSDQGLADITWTMTVEQEADDANLNRLTVTVERGEQSQSLTELVFVRPQTTTTTAGATP